MLRSLNKISYVRIECWNLIWLGQESQFYQLQFHFGWLHHQQRTYGSIFEHTHLWHDSLQGCYVVKFHVNSVKELECVTLCVPFISRWIVQAMKHELKIRAGDMPVQDIYQMSPSDIKQLLLDVLQPQHHCRYSTLQKHTATHTLSRTLSGGFWLFSIHKSAFEDTLSLSPCVYLLYNPFSFNYFIFSSVLSTSTSYYLLLPQPNFPLGIKVLSYLI